MAVVIETTVGDITVDLFLEERPKACLNFLKLCKLKYYNFSLFHTIEHGFIAQVITKIQVPIKLHLIISIIYRQVIRLEAEMVVNLFGVYWKDRTNDSLKQNINRKFVIQIPVYCQWLVWAIISSVRSFF